MKIVAEAYLEYDEMDCWGERGCPDSCSKDSD